MPSDSIVEREFSSPTVFKDESKLSPEYVPPRLPHREEELKRLAQTFRVMVESPGSTAPRLMVRGPLGTGKTALTKRFGADLQAYASKKGVPLKFVHVNCREEGSFYSALKTLIKKSLGEEIPERGYSAEELLETLVEFLEKCGLYMLLALDEVEVLVRKEGSDPLFNLTRLGEKIPLEKPRRLALIFIFREPECEDALALLDPSTRSTLGHNTVKLGKYTPAQLKRILQYRVEEAFKEDAVLPEALELAADLAGEYGDARLAIELVLLAGKQADIERSPKVLPEHVRAAQLHVNPAIRGEHLKALTLHEKLLLLAAARLLQSSDSAYVSFGEVEREYQAACEEYRENPRRHTQLWKYVKALSASGLLNAKTSGRGLRGRTTLIGLPAPSSLVRSQIEGLLEEAG
ncbi:MAG: ORC1-type DNA replication protein [Candidatus Hecatellaceae archaeon]